MLEFVTGNGERGVPVSAAALGDGGGGGSGGQEGDESELHFVLVVGGGNERLTVRVK
jgi:hypothetical protein